MSMISFFLLRGHSHEILVNLSPYEKRFYRATMETYIEQMNDIGKQ